jgi:hypothetical protein
MHTPEWPILEWSKREAARLRLPELVQVEAGDASARRQLERQRERVIDAYVDEVIDKAERDRRLRKVDVEAEALTARKSLEAIPKIDWTWSPVELNSVLRAMWEHILLDANMRPVEAVWRVPEWRQ